MSIEERIEAKRREIEARYVVPDSSRDALEVYCRTHGRMEMSRAFVRADGEMVRDPAGRMTRNPWSELADKLEDRLLKQWRDLHRTLSRRPG